MIWSSPSNGHEKWNQLYSMPVRCLPRLSAAAAHFAACLPVAFGACCRLHHQEYTNQQTRTQKMAHVPFVSDLPAVATAAPAVCRERPEPRAGAGGDGRVRAVLFGAAASHCRQPLPRNHCQREDGRTGWRQEERTEVGHGGRQLLQHRPRRQVMLAFDTKLSPLPFDMAFVEGDTMTTTTTTTTTTRNSNAGVARMIAVLFRYIPSDSDSSPSVVSRPGSDSLAKVVRNSSKPQRSSLLPSPGWDTWVLLSTVEYAKEVMVSAPPGGAPPELLERVAAELLAAFATTTAPLFETAGLAMPAPVFSKAHRWGAAYPKVVLTGDKVQLQRHSVDSPVYSQFVSTHEPWC